MCKNRQRRTTRIPSGVDRSKIKKLDDTTIRDTICQLLDITPNILYEKTRKRAVVDIRHLIGYTLSIKKDISLRAISMITGHKSHASVWHSVKIIEGFMDVDRKFRRDLGVLFEVLQSKD